MIWPCLEKMFLGSTTVVTGQDLCLANSHCFPSGIWKHCVKVKVVMSVWVLKNSGLGHIQLMSAPLVAWFSEVTANSGWVFPLSLLKFSEVRALYTSGNILNLGYIHSLFYNSPLAFYLYTLYDFIFYKFCVYVFI